MYFTILKTRFYYFRPKSFVLRGKNEILFDSQPPPPHIQKYMMAFVFVVDNVEKRIDNINDFFTFSLYSNVCRSLFEKHKLLFSFLVCVRILMNDSKINMASTNFRR